MALKLLIVVAIVLAGYLTVQAVSTLSPGDARSHVIWASEAFGIAFGLWLLLSWGWRQRRAGAVLHDVTDVKSRAAGGFLLISAGLLLTAWWMQGAQFNALESLSVPLSIVFIFAAIEELRWGAKLTERGVLRFHGLKPHQGAVAGRVDRVGGLAVVLAYCALLVAHAWVAPGGVVLGNGIQVRFVLDNGYAESSIVFVRAPGAELRAVVDNLRADGTTASIANVDLGRPEPGDRIKWNLRRNPRAEDPAHAYLLTVIYDDEIRIHQIPPPFPMDDAVFPRRYPVDDGAIVLAYSSPEGPYGAFEDLEPGEITGQLSLRFESSQVNATRVSR